MKLIVGLGNPGKKYDNTRHNTGYMVIDALCEELSVQCDQKKFHGIYTKVRYQGEDVILLKPETYMNNSGLSISECMHFFKIKSQDLLVIYDDLDMPTGKLRLREKGGSGGHNGIKSIISYLGTQEFKRIRVGINKIPRWDTIDYVLGRFQKDELPYIQEGIKNASKACICYLEDGFNKAMNLYN